MRFYNRLRLYYGGIDRRPRWDFRARPDEEDLPT